MLQFTDILQGRLRTPFMAPAFTAVSVEIDEDYVIGSCGYRTYGWFADSSIINGGASFGLLIINIFRDAETAELRQTKEDAIGTVPRAYSIDGITIGAVSGYVSGREDCGNSYLISVGQWLMTGDPPGQFPTVNNDGRLRGSFQSPAAQGYREIWVWDLVPIREP